MSKLTAPVRWLILGLGVTGLSCARHLYRRGDPLAVWDSRETPPGADTLAREFPEIPLLTGEFDADDLERAQTLVISPGIPLAHPAIAKALEAGVEVIGDIELFAREVDAPVVAITGSNGKSTVTTLVGEMAREAGCSVGVGGNIGTPALDLLGQGHDCYVLELSSFQLETTTSLRPRIATVLNVSDDHLDRYRNFGHYRDTKATIYTGAELVLENAEDEQTDSGRSDSRSFGLGQGDYRLDRGWLMARERPMLTVGEMALVGSHNQANALAAIALGEALGLPDDAMVRALKGFGGLPHRCETVAIKEGVHYVNDSKATNVGATLAALQGMSDFPGRLHLIAGGVGKGADFSPLKPWLEGRVSQLATLGQDGDAIATLKAGSVKCASLEEGVRLLAARAQPGDMVLLSPACASLDMFANYMVRGQAFRDAVEAL